MEINICNLLAIGSLRLSAALYSSWPPCPHFWIYGDSTLEIILEQTGHDKDGTPNFDKPKDKEASLLGSLATFAVSHVVGTAVFLGVGCAVAAICPPLVPVLIIGAACMREY